MRLASPDMDPRVQADIMKFSQWVLDLGEGRLPVEKISPEEPEPTWINIPDEFVARTDGDKISYISSIVYTDFENIFSDPTYLCKRAVLTEMIVLTTSIHTCYPLFQDLRTKEYFSYDTISKSGDSVGDANLLYTVDFLNSIKLNNFLQHRLLKKGAPIMLLRNLSQGDALCNGTRLIVTKLAELIIEAMIITGTNVSDIVYIPRIVLASQKSKMPFILQRRQFPVKVCYAMTTNKSQGQTLDTVGVYLKKPIFTHGQLYVAVSWVTLCAYTYFENEDGSCGSRTRNIVY